MDIIQIILLAVVTFIFAIDQFSLTETLYRPIISCTIIGAILGNMEIGLLVGGTYEIMVIGNMPVGGAQPPNVIIAGAVSYTHLAYLRRGSTLLEICFSTLHV